MSAYPYAVDHTQVPALLWTAHGGQAAGAALARVLAGEVSPAGRLPQPPACTHPAPRGTFVALTDEAIDKIKAMILDGELAPGSRLPKEEILAGQLGLPRNSLREAVRALTAMRILITRQGDGTYVSSLEPHLLLESLSFAADVSQGHTALQLVQVRRLLEPQATGLAAALLTPEDRQELRDILDRSRASTTVEEFVAHDIAFHLRIVEAVGNPVLSMLPQVLSTRTQRVRIVRGSRTRDALDNAHQDHEQILGALQSHDALLAAAAATIHITAVEQWLAASLSDDPLRAIDG